MEEKCYRDLQSHGDIAGVSLFELLALVAVPIVLIPVFTLFELNFVFIILIEVILYAVLRMANRLSPFRYGLISFVFSRFVWPRRLSAFQLREEDYLIRRELE